ncbi:ATP-dependent protease ATPase subunit HslU [Leptospira sp. GIMC2001]|uniref:ATP-dependent protease ATPase subunit HslU n=1 Tax=Leptospira sp. GIMC2001 TaxID=1513297 RepID=UPI00234B9EF9|nr:ATP-dependent protease ATPase subunit HslU [Leptospira sp. GIMC2001]WCL50600.1 ATP-dependent protease ATPase subunit HslU [Leptospira sp. GIMC2001]
MENIEINPSEAMDLTPRQTVEKLDEHIIGQKNAKRAVAIALRNRTRRRKLDAEMREEVYPKNIIMIGPTGVGKTEIARRLSKLCNAPFIKVEATKYTEVGYVGRDVESMIRDLAIIALNMVKQEFRESVTDKANERAEELLLDILLPAPQASAQSNGSSQGLGSDSQRVAMGFQDTPTEEPQTRYVASREMMRAKLKSGKLDDQEVEIDQPQSGPSGMPMLQVFGAGNMEDLDNQLQNVLGDLMPKKNKKKKLKIKDAFKSLSEQEADKLLDPDKLQAEAKKRVEEMGIVFLDEIDKIAGKESRSGADVSREGVQRDLLPIVEGATINTKLGPIKTDHILFIAAGAFHMSKPSDLIPEMQGRFPIRVELDKLSMEDFVQILTAPKSSLVRQYEALLLTEGVNLQYNTDGIAEIARLAFEMNEKNENIGARRLNTIMEKLLEDVSFDAPDLPSDQRNVVITKEFVSGKLKGIVEDKDLSKYIL